jgi:hypothetical protein
MSFWTWFGLLVLVFAWHGARWFWRIVGLALVRRMVLSAARDGLQSLRGVSECRTDQTGDTAMTREPESTSAPSVGTGPAT